MADRPIPFSGPMVRSIHEGRKTMTRRVLRPQPAVYTPMVIDITTPIFDEDEGGWGQWETIWSRGMDGNIEPDREVWQPLPLKYATGDRLWVRESYFQYGHWIALPGWTVNGKRMPWRFSPDDNEIRFEMHGPYRKAMDRWDPTTPAWHKRLGRFMPRSASRTTLIVTDVKVERLQDISEEDAQAEGAEPLVMDDEGAFYQRSSGGTYRCGFAGLWSHINGPGSWDANPWVAAITFRPVFANIDSPEAK